MHFSCISIADFGNINAGSVKLQKLILHLLNRNESYILSINGNDKLNFLNIN